MILSQFIRTHRLLRGTAATVSASVAAVLLTGTLSATPIPANLGNGLDKVVASNLAITTARANGTLAEDSLVKAGGKKYIDQTSADYGALAITDSQDRVLVRITLNGKTTYKATHKAMKKAIASLSITAEDKTYRGVGVMNAYVDVADVPALAQVTGVSAVIMELKPFVKRVHLDKALATGGTNVVTGQVLNKLGTAFDQGVTQHRVDTINQFYNPSATLDYEGTGMQVGCMSDSFDSDTTGSSATDISTYDLPGSATDPVGNTTPVYNFQDITGGTDEGRAMCQIVHKMAPKATIAFATGDNGEVSFADNIRGLAGISGYTNSGQTFAADTICDDLGYYDEPYFQDGIIAGGVADASAAGVCYFSSAGNDIGSAGYDSQLRFVANGTGLTAAAGNTALAGTNINLANVPTNLYAGGFHNFNPAAGGLQVAQTVGIAANSTVLTALQWNEPYDQTAVPQNETLIYTVNGDYTSSSDNAYSYTIPNTLTAGTLYELDEVANGDGFDGAITITSPSGTVLVPRQDNAVDEVVRFKADVTASGYIVTVGHYSTTTGNFTLNLYSTTGFGGNTVQTQISLLVFDSLGNYLPASSLTQNALTTDEPLQLGYTNYSTTSGTARQVQYVIARANVPTGPNVATEVRYLLPGDGLAGYGPEQFFNYTTVTTGGHAMQTTCNGMAAYSVFRPSLPEYYSSPGPVTVYYDANNNRLATPDVRLQPRLAAADNANNSFFASDGSSDPDTNPNFAGTSAAGPHAAAIGALVLQAHGGRRSMTPAQMTSLLERSTFPHDLDPNFSSGAARVSTGGKVTVTISSDDSTGSTAEGTAYVPGKNDPNAFTVNYVGASSVTSIVFNPGGTAATAGNVSMGNNGVTYTPVSSTTAEGTATYFENSLPGAIFLPATKAFTLGTGVTITPLTAVTYTNPSSTVASQMYTMTVTIPSGTLTGGQILRFGVGRGFARTASTGSTGVVVSSLSGGAYYCADILGGGVTIPEGTVTTGGMTFSGTTADGGTFSGVIKNNIGSGYSPLDGYGFINAQTAVSQTVQ